MKRPRIQLNARNPFYGLRPNVVIAVLVAAWVVHAATGLVTSSFADAMQLMSSNVPADVRKGANTLMAHLLGLQVHTLAITGLFALAGKFAERGEDPPTVPADAHRHDVDALAGLMREMLTKLPDESDERIVRGAEDTLRRVREES